MAMLSQVANEALTQSIPVWGFWLVALIVCGHALWIGLCSIFGIRWPGLLSTSICSMAAFTGLVALWNQAPLDEVVSSQPSLTWLSIGNPIELKIAACFHADRLASGMLLWLLPLISLVWIGEQSRSSSGLLAAVSLMLLFLLSFAGDAWVFLVVWMLMAPISSALLWTHQKPPRSRDLMKCLIPMLVTDLGLLLSISVIGSGLSTTKLAGTLHRDTLATIFQDNPAALDTAALGIWLAVCGRLLLPLVSLGNELWSGRSLTSISKFHLLFGLAPACILLLKLHHVIWNSTIIESLVLMTLVIGVLSAIIAACSNQRESAFGWSFSWAGSLVLAAIMSGMKASLISGLFVFASWTALLLVTGWQSSSKSPNRWMTWTMLILVASSVCGQMGLLHEFARNHQLIAIITIILGQGLTLLAWTKALLKPSTDNGFQVPSRPRIAFLLPFLTILWALAIGLIMTQRAWWQSTEGLNLLAGSLSWTDVVGPFQQAGVYSQWGLACSIAGFLGVITAVLVTRVHTLKTMSAELSKSSLITLGQQGLYTSEAFFSISLFVRGVAQLTRMFDWIVAGFLTGRVPQKITSSIQSELNTLTHLSVPWMIMTWMFATTIMLVIFLRAN